MRGNNSKHSWTRGECGCYSFIHPCLIRSHPHTELICCSVLVIACALLVLSPPNSKVRAIGVSNFGVAKLKKLVGKTRIPVAVNQIEGHPYLTQPDLLDYCKKNEIVVSAYFVIGSIRRVKLLRSEDDPVLLEEPTIAAIAAEVKASPAQVLTSWALHRGTVPIVKSISAKRIQENWDSYSVALTNAQIKRYGFA